MKGEIMKNRKIKKIIVSILRLLPLLSILLVLLNVFRLGLDGTLADNYNTIITTITTILSQNMPDFTTEVVTWLSTNFSANNTMVCIYYIGCFELLVTFLVGLYNACTFIFNYLEKVVGDFLYD